MPIHPGSNITKAQSMLLLVSFMQRHNLTDEALKDLLSILDLLLPSVFPISKYKFYKAFDVEESEVKSLCELKPSHVQCDSCFYFILLVPVCTILCLCYCFTTVLFSNSKVTSQAISTVYAKNVN